MIQLLLVIHVFCCIQMTGMIWLIQLTHYPAFHYVDKMQFAQFHSLHTRTLGLLAGPLMTIELLTGAGLAYLKGSVFYANLLVVILLWVSTFLISVPIHRRLEQGYDEKSVQRLVRTNWPRTVLWTLRSLYLLFFL